MGPKPWPPSTACHFPGGCSWFSWSTKTITNTSLMRWIVHTYWSMVDIKHVPLFGGSFELNYDHSHGEWTLQPPDSRDTACQTESYITVWVSKRGKGTPSNWGPVCCAKRFFNSLNKVSTLFPRFLDGVIKAQAGYVTSSKVREPGSVRGSLITQVCLGPVLQN